MTVANEEAQGKTHRGKPGDRLHHEDGTHRSTPPTTSGTDLERHEAAIRAHVADGHEHEANVAP